MTTTDQSTFESHLDRAVRTLQGAVIDLIAGAGVSTDSSQFLSKKFGLNRNLTWKVVRAVTAVDSLSAARHIPRASGMEMFISGFEKAGVDKERVEAARQAMREFELVIGEHADDRATLDLILDSMGVGEDAEQLALSRKLAFQGNSGICGIQARVKSTLSVLAPSRDDPSRLDEALVGGFVGFRRLRQGAAWPLFQVGHYSDDGTPVSDGQYTEEPIDPSYQGDSALDLMPDFCSGFVPKIIGKRNNTTTEYSIGPGPVGNSGVFDCFFGNLSRGSASRYAVENDTVCEFFSVVSAPVETLMFDVIAHRDLGFLRDLSFSIFAIPSGIAELREDYDVSMRLPIAEPVAPLGEQPAIVATPLIPCYNELVMKVFARGGWDPSEFFGLRVVLEYPPMPSMVVLRAQLDERP